MRSEPELGSLSGVTSPAASSAALEGKLPLAASGRTLSQMSGEVADSWRPSKRRPLEWLKTALATDVARGWIIAIALLLTSGALSLGLTADDHFQTLAIRQGHVAGVEYAPWDLFAYAKNREAVTQLMDEGMYPWWTSPDARLAFMRPISSLSIWLDHKLWPNRPFMMHLHSLLWFAALLWIVGRIYRRAAGPTLLCGLSLALFAFDDARAHTVGWICNRNALIALVFGFGALLAHDHWRRAGDRVAGFSAPLLLALGLFSGEPALQVCAYLFAYALCVDHGSKWQRFLSLVPYAVVVIGWRALYVAFDYGAFGSGLYIDPGRDLWGFLTAACHRLPLLLTAQFTGILAEIGDTLPVLAPAAVPLLLPFCLLILALLAMLFRPLWRNDTGVRFWTIGAVLSTLPVCGVSPTDRVLTATALGAAPLVAIVLVNLLERSYPARSKLTVAAGVALAVMHLVIAPIMLPVRTRAVDHFEDLLREADTTIPSDAAVQAKTVILLNPPVDPYGVYFPLYRAAQGIKRPQHVRWLATGVSALDITRVDANTIKVRPKAGFLSNSSQWALRDPKIPAVLGEQILLSGVRFEVTALTEDQRPAEVTARFDQPLESSKLVWLQWGQHGYVPFTPPALGAAAHIPAVDLVKALF